MNRQEEFALKRERVERWLSEHGLDGVVLSRSDNFAWLGCGADNVVNIAQECGVGSLVVQPGQVTLVANNIEAERLLVEEIEGLEIAGPETFPWHEAERRTELLHRIAAGRRFAADDGTSALAALPPGFARLRYELTGAEVERYRKLGADLSAAIEAAALAVERGMTEAEIAAIMATNCQKAGITPIVVLVAADDRLISWRHPVPKDTPVERCAMMVVCGRRWGLVGALTRLVHFGKVPEDLRCRHRAACAVDAAMIAATQPGRTASEVFAAAQRAYKENGFDEEWRYHHQGGAIGYNPREYIAHHRCSEVVLVHQAFAWNPSIRGTKSEDTILVTSEGHLFLTAPSPKWPAIEVEVDGRTIRRADILVK